MDAVPGIVAVLRRMGRTGPVRAVAVSFGAILLASAWLKVAHPHAAAAGLGWSGLDMASRYLLVAIGGGVEAFLGASLLLLPGSRHTNLAVALLSQVMLMLHLLSAEADCGCFGALFVPRAVTLTLLVAGGTCCALRGACMRGRQPLVRARQALAALGALSCMGLGWALGPGAVVGSPQVELEQAIRARHAGGPAQVMIGTWKCDHCQQLLGRLLATQDLPLLFVHREDDRPPALGPGVLPFAIAADVWWNLVAGSAPPVRLHWRGDQLYPVDRP